MRSLVIGGNLFIGRALVQRLLARGDEVTILHRGGSNPFGDQVEEIHCDRNDSQRMRSALQGRRFEFVFDNVYDWQRGTPPDPVVTVALDLAGGLKRYVFTSTCAVYLEGENLTEDAPLAPADCPSDYQRNKAETERALFRLHQQHDVHCVTLRPPFIYGPENPFYRESFFWDRILAGRPVIIPGDGTRRMQFVLADDYARASVLASEKEAAVGRAYNIADPEPVTQEQWVQALARAAGRSVRLVRVPRQEIEAAGGKVFEPPYYFGQYLDLPPITQDTSRAREELGFTATPLEEGLRRTFEWYRGRKDRPAPDFSWEDKLLARFL